jgi:HPt (histidine-containing phosphotransfer) domain-containing protein
LAEFFLRDAKKTAAVMEAIYINKCRRTDDISMFIINIHAMKSALANVGETSLSEKASKLEQAGRDKDVDIILSELPSFIESIYAVIYKFEVKEKDSEESSESESDNSLLKEKLGEIRNACSIYDKKAAKNLLAELKKKSWSQPVKEHLRILSEYLLHSDFDEAAKAIEEYIKQM